MLLLLLLQEGHAVTDAAPAPNLNEGVAALTTYGESLLQTETRAASQLPAEKKLQVDCEEVWSTRDDGSARHSF